MAKYMVKLTKFKNRCSITLPVHLVEKRGLKRYKYILIKAQNNKPITMKGYVDEKDLQ